MSAFRLLAPLAALSLFALPATAADTSASATYVVDLGGTIIANASFNFTDTGSNYDLKLTASVSGVAQLVASGSATASSTGTDIAGGLRSNSFDLTTKSGGDTFSDTVQYQGGDVSAFIIDPPITNDINRVPIERSQLTGVNDMMATFILKGTKLDKALCNQHMHLFTGVERFDLDLSYEKDDTATSPRTGYQGPVVLCRVKYTPISGHYTTSNLTNELAKGDRILIWYAPLRDTGYFIPYRVLMNTSAGEISLVLTALN